MGVGAHYHKDGKMVSFILDFLELEMVRTTVPANDEHNLLSQSHNGLNMACALYDVLCKYNVQEKVSLEPQHQQQKRSTDRALQMGKLMADGALNNDTMAATLSKLVDHFVREDRGRCIDHIVHLCAIRIINPFDAQPEQLERALVEAAYELEGVGEDLTSLGDGDDEEERGEGRAEQEEEEERHFRDIAVELASKLTGQECEDFAAACLPGAGALTKVRAFHFRCILRMLTCSICSFGALYLILCLSLSPTLNPHPVPCSVSHSHLNFRLSCVHLLLPYHVSHALCVRHLACAIPRSHANHPPLVVFHRHYPRNLSPCLVHMHRSFCRANLTHL